MIIYFTTRLQSKMNLDFPSIKYLTFQDLISAQQLKPYIFLTTALPDLSGIGIIISGLSEKKLSIADRDPSQIS
jgi:hypothetical protein